MKKFILLSFLFCSVAFLNAENYSPIQDLEQTTISALEMASNIAFEVEQPTNKDLISPKLMQLTNFERSVNYAFLGGILSTVGGMLGLGGGSAPAPPPVPMPAPAPPQVIQVPSGGDKEGGSSNMMMMMGIGLFAILGLGFMMKK